MSDRSKICKVAKRQLEVRDRIDRQQRENAAEEKWQETCLKIKVEYQSGDMLQVKDYLAELYGILAYMDANDQT